MIWKLLALPAVCLLTGCPGAQHAVAPPQNYSAQSGDFVFQSLPHEPLIDAIEGSTGSPFSHCGIVVQRSGRWMVIEAIGPVKETPLPAWIAQGRDNAFVACRLRAPLAGNIPGIIAAAERYEGRPYDLHYDFDDERIYCSELIFKAVRDATGRSIGQIRKLGELNWCPYEKVIREIEGGSLPLDRRMITPRDLSEAPELRQVFRHRM